jgi:ArsR family transcriptional regulator
MNDKPRGRDPVRTTARTTKRRADTAGPADLEFARLAKALGHPARVAILRRLIERGECVCGQIVSELPLAQATVSQHLRVLKDAGLIQGEVDGPRVCYCVNPDAVRRLGTLIGALAAPERRES